MLVPPVCLTCGCAIGDKAVLFKAMHRKKVKEALEQANPGEPIHPGRAAESMALNMDASDILDKLRIRNDCCRTHLTTSMDWRDYY